MSVSIHEHEFVVAERDALRRELASARAEICRRVTLNEMTQQLEETEKSLAKYYETQLAASQASEQQLREALELVLPMAKGYAADHQVGSNAAYCVQAQQALALQQDTTALEAIITKAGEVMREAAQNACTSRSIGTDHDDFDEWDYCNYGCADAIRALPAITLDDLKGGEA